MTLAAQVDDNQSNVITKTTELQKVCSIQEELVSCLNQKLTSVLRQYEEPKEDSPGIAPVRSQSPLCDELDLLTGRIDRHNNMLRDMIHRLDT